MSSIASSGGELRGTVTITRKATGAVETYQIVGRVTPEQAKEIEEMLDTARAPQAAQPDTE